MKKLLIPLLITASITTAYAGNHHGEHHSNHKYPDKISHLIDRIDNLSVEQKSALEKLRPVSKSETKATKEFIHGPEQIKKLDSSAADYQAKVDEIANKIADQAKTRFFAHAAMHAKINEILTDEQRKQLQQGKRCGSKK